MSNSLDLYDRKIMGELDLDARLPASKIARRVKLSKESVIYRIRRLIEKGYVKNFYTIINAALFGFRYYEVFLRFQKLSAEKEQKIIEYLKQCSNCINIRLTDGKYGLVFLTAHKSRINLKYFLQDFCHRFGQNLLQKNVHTVIAGYKLAQRTLLPGESVKKPFYHGEDSIGELDETDKKILAALANDARIKTVDLATLANEEARKVQYRIKKLQRNHVIVGYSTALNLSMLSRQFVIINFRLKDPSKGLSIIEFFDHTQCAIFAYDLLGDYDLSLELYVKNDAVLQDILRKFREKFLDYYISYDLAHVYAEYNLAWLPLTLSEPIKHFSSKGNIPQPAYYF